jgi:hypothetical protein
MSAAVLHTHIVTYALRNGARGVLHVLADSTCAAILVAHDHFGHALRRASARRA